MRQADVLRHERRHMEAVHADLHRRRWLRWHAFLLAAVCMAIGWGLSAGLMALGVDHLALRWPAAVGLAYLVYIGLLGLWCHWLVSRDEGNGPQLDVPLPSGGGPAEAPGFEAGGGGDFGGGAGGSFDGSDVAIETAGKTAGHVLEVAAGADEGAIIAVPLALAVGVALLIAGALGVAVFGLFGVEVLLGVAVEIVLASAGGAVAYKARREGWLQHAVRRTFAPFAAILVLTALAGLAVDQLLPSARSLPQAVRMLVS
jgi:hypothetical protein